jgi:hypothetical protein
VSKKQSFYQRIDNLRHLLAAAAVFKAAGDLCAAELDLEDWSGVTDDDIARRIDRDMARVIALADQLRAKYNVLAVAEVAHIERDHKALRDRTPKRGTIPTAGITRE